MNIEDILKDFDKKFGLLIEIKTLEHIERLRRETGANWEAYPENEAIKEFLKTSFKYIVQKTAQECYLETVLVENGEGPASRAIKSKFKL